MLTISTNKVKASDLTITSVPIGGKVMFANMEWIMINPSKGKLILNNLDEYRQWGSIGSIYSNSSIRNYLNNESIGFISKIPLLDRGFVITKTWDVGPNGRESSVTVNDKIGLISYSEYVSLLSAVFPSNGEGYQWWLSTPQYGASQVWIVSPNGSLDSVTAPNNSNYVRPSLHLKLDTIISYNGVSYTAITNSEPTLYVTIENSYFSKVNQAQWL